MSRSPTREMDRTFAVCLGVPYSCSGRAALTVATYSDAAECLSGAHVYQSALALTFSTDFDAILTPCVSTKGRPPRVDRVKRNE